MWLLINLIDLCVQLYTILIVVQVVAQWLIIFDGLNKENPHVQKALNFMHKATEPVFKPIQDVIKPIGGVDLTPLIAIIGINVAWRLIQSLLFYLFIY